MAYTFDLKRGVYRDHGKSVSDDELTAVVDDEIEASQAEIEDETDGQDLTTAAAIAALLLLLGGVVESLFVRLYVIGRGGLAQMEDDDWQAVGGMVTEQKRYLGGLESDLKAGRTSSAEAAARALLYAAAARRAFGSGRAVAAERAGKRQERWVISPGENCSGCLAYAGQGWVSIGTLPTPAAGATPCRANCRCHKIYK